MTFNLSLTCLQYTSTEQESVTLKAIKPLINEAVNHGSNFIALPECATSLQSNPEQTKKTTTEAENISLQTFIEMAKNNKIYVLIGSLPIKLEHKIANRSFLI